MFADATTFEGIASFGAAGLMGAMWLWERRMSNARENQIDDAHQRIMADGIKLEALMDLVQKNTETLSRLLAAHDQVLRKLEEK